MANIRSGFTISGVRALGSKPLSETDNTDVDPPTLYCDASRTMAGYTVVAGAVASVQDWLDFDREWTAALRENGLLYFRMTEFAQSTRQFKVGWKANETRRREFLLRLAQIIVDHVACWIGVCVSQKDYDAADSIYRLHEFLQPYPLCGLTCIELAHKWQKVHRLEYLPMECV